MSELRLKILVGGDKKEHPAKKALWDSFPRFAAMPTPVREPRAEFVVSEVYCKPHMPRTHPRTCGYTLRGAVKMDKAFHELYIDELKDLYNAENQLVKALPKMAKAAVSPDLQAGFKEHLEQTKGHVQRLEQIFENLGESPKGKKCKGMEGLIAEGSEAIEEYDGSVLDAALIGAAQRVEHYEMAGYGTAIAFAKEMGHDEHVSLLEETLNEEKETDEKLTELSSDINAEANQGENEAEEDSDETEERQTKATSKSRRVA
jgi:ferritin-like metal-binding protein YciE